MDVDVYHIQDLTLENVQSREKLSISKHEKDEKGFVAIRRYPIWANQKWIEEMCKFSGREYRNIVIEEEYEYYDPPSPCENWGNETD
jgi:hypothetical protein